ncbi:MAG: DUF3179 domain-containing protein [Nanoarchaeota archaeon]|nr:DUF3179 domain-containing protein [Nanoarchaeota archaeon]
MKLGVILVFSIITIMIVPAYGDVTSLKTDKSIYSIGDKIVFLGTSNNPGEIVNVAIKNTFGNTVEFKSGFVNSAGDFSLFPIIADNKIFDKNTKSEWNFFGQAINGSLEGKRLKPVPIVYAFWFGWVAEYPDTELYNT